jgi:hypothetical protein
VPVLRRFVGAGLVKNLPQEPEALAALMHANAEQFLRAVNGTLDLGHGGRCQAPNLR